MHGILLLTENIRGLTSVQSALVRDSYRVAVCPLEEDAIIEAVSQITPELIIADCRHDIKYAASARHMIISECNLNEIQTIALIATEQIKQMEWKGIDEFLTEPFNSDELLIRLKLLFWKTKKISSDQLIKIDELIIDLENYVVTIEDDPIELTYKEYELLRFLATHRGRVFTREALLDHVWGYDYYGGTRTVDVHIRRLRSKMTSTCDYLIETVRNVGYRFIS